MPLYLSLLVCVYLLDQYIRMYLDAYVHTYVYIHKNTFMYLLSLLALFFDLSVCVLTWICM